MAIGFYPEERERLVSAYYESERRTSAPNFDKLSDEELAAEYQRQEDLLAEYAEWLPFVPVSRCPKCGEVLEFPFDPMGLDGPWWMAASIFEYPQAVGCEHFQVLLGAIDFHGREPSEAAVNDRVLPGPGVPFLVSEIIDIEGVQAVISQVQMAHGDTAYLIAYFSDAPFDVSQTHQPWAREVIDIKDDDGEYEGWTVSTALWTFDLAPYVQCGSVKWIFPGDETLTLQAEGQCPFIDLPGVREPQVMEDGEWGTLDLPGEEEVDPTD